MDEKNEDIMDCESSNLSMIVESSFIHLKTSISMDSSTSSTLNSSSTTSCFDSSINITDDDSLTEDMEKKLKIHQNDIEVSIDDKSSKDEVIKKESIDQSNKSLCSKSHQRKNVYANILSKSKWMLQIPEDFEKWLMVACSLGKRVLIEANKGVTTMYSKGGYILKNFFSALPGGNELNNKRGYLTQLDCIWVEKEKTIYVLDILSWAKHQLVYCDTDFRFNWLQARFSEIPELQDRTNGEVNKFSILILPRVSCEKNAVQSFINGMSVQNLDGFLIYHKYEHYASSNEVSVLWTKPFMLSEFLNDVKLPNGNVYFKKPNDYLNFKRYIIKDTMEKLKNERLWKMKIEEDRNNNKVKSNINEKNIGLMEYDWMIERPIGFPDKWTAVVYPRGERVLVIANQGNTSMYSKSGDLKRVFNTFLPGGSKKTFKNNYTILDCIWSSEKKICYVLDLLAWSNQEMLNCDTEFRFYWLTSQFSILTADPENGKINDFPVVLLPRISCSMDLVVFLKDTSSSIDEIDALLFYHKDTTYALDSVNSVLWLKIFMLKEMLNFNVPEKFLRFPSNYVNFEDYVLNEVINYN